ncbi:MAG: endonuclease/exonuclease/phosphatase family protein [Proteobacteria bacterium]|nr:endonuclease/exonuclease/phosphatase family protein [Pseudomonadota bacterium]
MSPAATSVNAISVATYNVHRCIGLDRIRDPARIASVIDELNVDVIGLQEVDARGRRIQNMLARRLGAPAERRAANAGDQFDYLAHKVGGHAVRGPVLRGPKGDMTTALITRHKIGAVRTLDLSLSAHEPRGAIDADIEIGNRSVRVIVAHLGLRVREREAQIALLCRALQAVPEQPLIVMGDFNEWHLHRSTLTPLDERLGHATPVPSFPARFPFLSLDRIWASREALVTHLHVHRSPLARRASDHLPVQATIRLPHQ